MISNITCVSVDVIHELFICNISTLTHRTLVFTKWPYSNVRFLMLLKREGKTCNLNFIEKAKVCQDYKCDKDLGVSQNILPDKHYV